MAEQRTDIRFSSIGASGVLRDLRGMGAGADQSFSRINSSSRVATRALAGISDGARRGATSLGRLATQGLALGAAFVGVQSIGQIFSAGTRAALDFETQMANVSTLITDTSVSVETLQSELLTLPPVLGSSADLAEALYQTLSAGVAPADAVRFVGDAARFARAGITSAETAVDVLTTTINAYGLASSDATRVSDVFFKTIERGKINAEQLATGIGPVIPLAESLGISIVEIGAATQALTAGGLAPSTAFDALRSSFTSFIQEADKFREAGVDIIQVIDERGLSGALEELRRLTGGNIERIRAFVPDVQGLTAVLSLAGAQADSFAQNLVVTQQALDEGGTTAVAFGKQTEAAKVAAEEFFNQLDRFVQEVAPPILSAFADATRGITDFVRQAGGAQATLAQIIDDLGGPDRQLELPGGLISVQLPDVRPEIDRIEEQLLAARGRLFNAQTSFLRFFTGDDPEVIQAEIAKLEEQLNSLEIATRSAVVASEPFGDELVAGGDAAAESTEKVSRAMQRAAERAAAAAAEFAGLEDNIEGIDLGGVVEQAEAITEAFERSFDRMASALDRLTDVRSLQVVERDIRDLEFALRDARVPGEIEAIQRALVELREEALRLKIGEEAFRDLEEAVASTRAEQERLLDLGTETFERTSDAAMEHAESVQAFYRDLNFEVSSLISDAATGQIKSFEDVERVIGQISDRLTRRLIDDQAEQLLAQRQAQQASQAQTAQGGGAGTSGAGAGTAGLIAVQGLQLATAAREIGQGFRSSDIDERREARGRLAVAGGGFFFGGPLIDLLDQTFADGAFARAIGGIFGGEKAELRVEFTTIADNVEQAIREELPNLVGAISGPFGDLIATDLDDIGEDAGREVVRFISGIDETAARFLNELQRASVTKALNLLEFDQSFGANIDDDNLSNILEERVAAIFNAAAAATPNILGESVGDLRDRIFAGVDEDDVSTVQERVRVFGEIFQTLGELARTDDITDAELALRDIEEQFGNLALAAEDFGLNVNIVTAAQERATRRLRENFEQGIGDAILGLIDPIELANVQLDRRRELLLAEAEVLGTSAELIEDLVRTEQRLLDVRREQEQIELQNRLRAIDQLVIDPSAEPGRSDPFVQQLFALQGNIDSLSGEIARLELVLEGQIRSGELRVDAINAEISRLLSVVSRGIGGGIPNEALIRELTQERTGLEEQLTGLRSDLAGLGDPANQLQIGAGFIAEEFARNLSDQLLQREDPFGFQQLDLDRTLAAALDAARILTEASGLAGLDPVVRDFFNSEQDRLEALTQNFNDRIASDILRFTDEDAFRQAQLQAQQQDLLEEARRFGGNVESLDELFQLQQEALDAQIAAAKAQEEAARVATQESELAPLESFLTGLVSSPSSPLAPTAVLESAKDVFGAALAGGDSRAVVSAAQNLLAASSDVFASGSQFFDIFNEVRAQVGSLAANIGARDLDGFASVRDVILDQTDDTARLLLRVIEALNTGNTGNEQIRVLLQRVTSSLRPGITS